MNNNDILRRLRYIFDLNDTEMLKVFALADITVSPKKLHQWLRREEDPEYAEMKDYSLAVFLNGLIAKFRGKREGEAPRAERKLTHNLILRKLKIALSLQSEEMLAIWQRVDFRLSKHELSSFFRQPGHRNYRVCQDQVLRNFLQGLQLKLRPESERTESESTESEQED